MGRFSSAGGSPAGTGVVWLDGEPLTLGTDDDAALVVIGSALAANEALTGVLIGTPVTAASTIASLLVSNVTALADIAFFLNDGSGNSWEWERFDSSAVLHVWNEAGSDIDHRFEGDTDTTLLVLDAGLDVVAIGGAAVSGVKLRLYGATRVSDDILLTLGSDGDVALVERSTILATNTVLTGVLVGVPVTPAIAANSLILGNVTADGDILIAAQTGGNSQAWIWVDSSAGLMNLYSAGVARIALTTAIGLTGAVTVNTSANLPNDILLTLGTGGDVALVERSTILATNTALTGVVVGTPITPAIAADTLIISNVTADGDLILLAQTGGNSQAWLWVDASAGTHTLYAAGVERIALTTAIALTGAVTINTSANLPNNILLTLGTGGDIALVENSAGLTANTALTGVLIGTPVTPAIAADSLIVANTTASGDILIAGNLGGNSRAYVFIDVSADTFDLMTAGVSRIRLGAAGFVGIGDTSNANMTVGLTLNQGAADNQILSFKSSDVAHGLLTPGLTQETDDYAVFGKRNTGEGGLIIQTTNADSGTSGVLNIRVIGGTGSSTKSTAARALAEIDLYEHDGFASFDNIAANGALFGIRGRVAAAQVTVFLVDVDGDIWHTGANYVGGTVHGQGTIGVYIDQAANDNLFFAVKSTGDVATGLTTAVTNTVETADILTMAKFAAATGGVLMQVLGENAAVTTNFQIESYGGQADTGAASATSRGLIDLYVSQHDGANGLANIAADGIVLAVRARVGAADRTILTLDEDGDLFMDGSGGVNTIGGFDAFDDAALARAATNARGSEKGIIRSRWDQFVKYDEDTLVDLEILSKRRSEGGLWNLGRNVQAINDGLWQMWTQIMEVARVLTPEQKAMLPQDMREKLALVG